MATPKAKPNAFHDLFSSWDDVKREFGATTPDVDEVIYARYGYEDYSGDALVVARKGKKYLVASGGHCSCYGLEEGGFAPTEFDRKTLEAMLTRIIEAGKDYGPETDMFSYRVEYAKAILENLKS
jgi:hypothetical protein